MEWGEIENRLTSFCKDAASASLYKNIISLVTNSFLTSILGFFFITVTTRVVSTAEVGIYSTILAVVSLLALLSRFGLDISLVRYLPQSKDSNSLINSCFIIGIFTSTVLSIVFIFGADYWVPSLAYTLSQPIFLFSFIGTVVLTVLIGFQMNIFVSRRSTKYLIIRDSANNVLKIALIMVLVMISMQISAIGLFYINGFALLISIYLGFLLLKRVKTDYLAKLEINFSQIKMMVKFSLGTYISSLIGTGAQLALPLMVINILGAENAAYFYIAWTLRNLIEVIPGAISTSLFAEGVNCPRDLYYNAKRSIVVSYLIAIPVIIATTAFGSSFLLIFGENYAQNSYHLLVLFAVSVLFSSANQVIYNVKLVNTDIRFILLYTGVSGLGLLLFSSIFMSLFGLIGVGLGLMVSQGILLIMILIISRVQGHKRVTVIG